MSFNVERCINKYIPQAELKEVKRILYGNSDNNELEISPATHAICEKNNFEVRAFKFDAEPEELRPPRIVRIAAVQHSINLPTTADLNDQRAAIHVKIEQFILAAAACNVNIISFAETWNMPFGLSTQEIHPWLDFAENVETGPTVTFLKKLAQQWNMVIVSPMLEHDADGNYSNAVAIISNTGNYMGKSRKNHIPCMEGCDNETTYYAQGNMGHPVFETEFGRIAVNICYGRHHPQHWMMFGLNGAEIVFNPTALELRASAIWEIEARNAAIANSFFTVAINRIGVERFNITKNGRIEEISFGPYMGSNYVSAPDGSRTPALSTDNDGLLIVELDLNLCRQVKNRWGFQMTQRLGEYGRVLTNAADPNFIPQVYREKKIRISIEKQ